jgi:tetratricopeptide (TPR) repeat protein
MAFNPNIALERVNKIAIFGFKHVVFICVLLSGLLSRVEAEEIRSVEEALRLGDKAFLNDKYSEAERFYRRASKLRPKQALPAMRLGDLFYAQSRYRDALSMFKLAETLKKDAATKKFLDEVLKKMNGAKILLTEIERTLRGGNLRVLDRLHAEAAEQMAIVPAYMQLLGPHLEYLLKKNPRDLRILNVLAEGNFSSGNSEKAFGYYKKLIREAPTLELYKRFGDVSVNVGAYDEARFAYKKALREAVHKRNIQGTRELKKLIRRLPAFTDQIDAKIQAEDYEGAFRELRKFLTRSPMHPWAVVEMGRIYEEIGRLTQAESLYQQAIRWNKEDPYAHYMLGRFYLMKRKKFEKALEEFKLYRVLLNDRQNLSENKIHQEKMREYSRDVTRSIAYIYLEVLRQPKKAVAEMEGLVKNGNPEAKDYYGLAIAYLREQKRTSAYQALKKSIDMDPKSDTAKDAEALIENMRIASREGFEIKTKR